MFNIIIIIIIIIYILLTDFFIIITFAVVIIITGICSPLFKKQQKAIAACNGYIEEYIKGFMTKDELDQKMKDVDIHFVQNDKDTAAYKHFKKFYRVAKLMRWVNERKNK